MSIEFTAVSLQREIFKKYQASSKLEAIWKLGPHLPEFFDDPRGALVSVKARLEILKAYIEDYDTLVSNIEAVVKGMEIPTRSLNLGTVWKELETHFEKSASKHPILKKAFHSSKATTHPISCSYGTIDFIEGGELKALAVALQAAGSPGDDLESDYEELLEFYQDAAENDDVVLRGLD